VLPWWEGADEAQSRCSFSHLIRYERPPALRRATDDDSCYRRAAWAGSPPHRETLPPRATAASSSGRLRVLRR
jgi:hypothetical protein